MAISAVGSLTNSTASTGQDTMSVSPTTVGNLMVFSYQIGSSSKAITAVTGGGADGTGWQRVTGAADVVNSSVGTGSMWWARVGTAGAQTLTITYSVAISTTSVERIWQEFTAGTGSGTTWTLDKNGSSNPNTNTTAVTWPSLVATGSGELYVGYMCSQNGFTSGATSGFTYQNTTPFNDCLIYNPTASGTLAPTGTQTSGRFITFGGLWIAGVTSIWGPPSGLTATAVSDNQIDLGWQAVVGASGYDIERDGVLIAADVAGTTYSDTGLNPGSSHTYRARSVRA